MFSQTVEYALRAVVFLAADPQTPRTTEQIAGGTCVPRGYLSKVLQHLARGGLVSSQRGVYGGFTLGRAPDEITVLEVVNAVDPIERIHQCPLGIKEHGRKLCPLHRKLDDALASIEEAFTHTTIMELLGAPRRQSPLCEMTPQG